jgi:DNA-binding GntR family transcriptional regulator
MALENVSDPATSADVAHELELAIVLGRIRPRERLIEDELMERFGAKRHVVRKALADLEARGLVERQQNKGARVRDYSRAEVTALYEFRAELHLMAVMKMPLPLAEPVLQALEQTHKRHQGAVARGDLAAVIAENNRFHEILFAECGNVFLAQTIERMAAATNAIRSYRIGDAGKLTLAVEEHAQMIDAARRGDRVHLATLCRHHILPSRDMYLSDMG